jgi:hypothetical protein
MRYHGSVNFLKYLTDTTYCKMLTGKTGDYPYDCATSEAASSFPPLSGPSLCCGPDLLAAAHRH